MLDQTEKLMQKYREIVVDYEQITGIYQREDLFLGVDLCFHSVLKFNFQNRPVIKGWVETLVIGDTRTGKTATVTNLINHFRLGEIITGENVSFAGLVGGIQQLADRRAVQWGKIPLADRRLIVIDEVSGLNIEDIGRMSGIRSSGIAEITKIQTERTLARTRQIWLSNPRRPQPMSAHSYGVLAVKDLIGRPEDIARFDVIVTCASRDVAENIYNKPHVRKKIKYTSSICRNLILWAWSRKPSDVVISSETEKLILKYATMQGEKYSSGIPIVEPAEQRIKLAKLSVAAAARFFSTDDSGEKIIVKPEHIVFVYQYLEKIYSNPSFRYDEWSERQLGKKKLGDIEAVNLLIENRYVIPLLESELLNITDVEHIVGNRPLANSIISTLRLEGCLQKTGPSVYKKTPAFIDYLRDRTRGMTDKEMKINTQDVPF
ncbi:hypothetical protein LCGC14_0704570 [marine sediment metagenome]|uniref:MCM domain-containing protein n=1 Tax=marine sediment metagenome TaxID=412755 RepID=A0A0F9QGY2_9ZZZZ